MVFHFAENSNDKWVNIPVECFFNICFSEYSIQRWKFHKSFKSFYPLNKLLCEILKCWNNKWLLIDDFNFLQQNFLHGNFQAFWKTKFWKCVFKNWRDNIVSLFITTFYSQDRSARKSSFKKYMAVDETTLNNVNWKLPRKYSSLDEP